MVELCAEKLKKPLEDGCMLLPVQNRSVAARFPVGNFGSHPGCDVLHFQDRIPGRCRLHCSLRTWPHSGVGFGRNRPDSQHSDDQWSKQRLFWTTERFKVSDCSSSSSCYFFLSRESSQKLWKWTTLEPMLCKTKWKIFLKQGGKQWQYVNFIDIIDCSNFWFCFRLWSQM